MIFNIHNLFHNNNWIHLVNTINDPQQKEDDELEVYMQNLVHQGPDKQSYRRLIQTQTNLRKVGYVNRVDFNFLCFSKFTSFLSSFLLLGTGKDTKNP